MKNFNYLLIIIGIAVAMFSKVGSDQNQYVLIVGIMILMLGVYRLSRTIPSRRDDGEDNDANETT